MAFQIQAVTGRYTALQVVTGRLRALHVVTDTSRNRVVTSRYRALQYVTRYRRYKGGEECLNRVKGV